MLNSKYRAWFKSSRKMVYNCIPLKNKYADYVTTDTDEHIHIDDKPIIMKSTNKQDDENIEIYESDILYVYDVALGVVEWHPKKEELYCRILWHQNWLGEYTYTKIYSNENRVMGNIYANPELLNPENYEGGLDGTD